MKFQAIASGMLSKGETVNYTDPLEVYFEGPSCEMGNADCGMRNEPKRKAKDRKHRGKDQIESPSKEKEFRRSDGNRFAVTPRDCSIALKPARRRNTPARIAISVNGVSDSRCSLCRKSPQSCIPKRALPVDVSESWWYKRRRSILHQRVEGFSRRMTQPRF